MLLSMPSELFAAFETGSPACVLLEAMGRSTGSAEKAKGAQCRAGGGLLASWSCSRNLLLPSEHRFQEGWSAPGSQGCGT